MQIRDPRFGFEDWNGTIELKETDFTVTCIMQNITVIIRL